MGLAKAGCDVGVTFHTDEVGARGTVDEVEATGRRAELRQLDVTDPSGARAVVRDLAGTLGGLDVFVNNAGIGGARRSSRSTSTSGGRRSRPT